MDSTRILAVDHDLDTSTRLQAVLEAHGFQMVAVRTLADALGRIQGEQFDILLTDLNIDQPGDGFTVIRATRQAQPDARIYMMAGYPDIGPALEAFRKHVDGCFARPLKPETLLSGLSAPADGQPCEIGERSVAQLLRDQVSTICQRWFEEVLRREELAALPLTREDRTDHIPDLLAELSRRLEEQGSELSPPAHDSAREHGRARYHQGYTIPQILLETRLLQKVLCQVVQDNLLTLRFDKLISDGLEIGQILQAQLEVSIRAFQAQVPTSMQGSLSMLYKSPYLGVVIADEYRVVDANDAFLKMIGHTREQLRRGEVSWVELTPEKYRPLDVAAVEQLREFGTCAPIEKEFILPDGSLLPFLIGAVRLTSDPLQWSAYVVNLTEQRRLQATEQKLQLAESRNRLINRLAHEVNNPLAALTFSTHLLSTNPDLAPDMANLVRDSVEMLNRVSAVVQKVLEESKP